MAKPGKPEKQEKPAEDEATDASPKKGRKKLIIIIIAVAVLVIGGGIAAFLLIKPSQDAATAEGKAAMEKLLAEKDAVLFDNSYLSREAQFEKLLNLVNEKLKA